jgi:hypothetical protein
LASADMARVGRTLLSANLKTIAERSLRKVSAPVRAKRRKKLPQVQCRVVLLCDLCGTSLRPLRFKLFFM